MLATRRDVRALGSGNAGVMNVMLNVSRLAGGFVFLSEALKGFLAVWLARFAALGEPAIGVAVIATIVGTRWSIWLRGAGGRGNTAAMAALLAISWPTLLTAGLLWSLARLASGRSFMASRVTLILWPVGFGLIERSWWALGFGAAISLLFLTGHRRESDDHLAIKRRWPSLGAFLTSPPQCWWRRRDVGQTGTGDRADSGDID